MKETVCPVCRSPRLRNILTIQNVPVHCNVLYDNRTEAIAAAVGSIELIFCSNCSHIFNKNFNPDLMTYTHEYENSLHFSSVFQDYAVTLAKDLVDTYGIEGRTVIEIGCGKGDFLKLICDYGNNKGIGFDKSYNSENQNNTGNIKFIQDFYSEKYSNIKADLLCCRHVLEHIQFPVIFLDSINSIIENKKEMLVYFEVPNSGFTIKDLGIWDIIYEHCGYFSLYSLTRIFVDSGFSVINRKEVFNSQFIQIIAKQSDHKSIICIDDKKEISIFEKSVSDFVRKYTEKIKYWKKIIEQIIGRGENAVIWGAGSKGVTFLNIFRDYNVFDYAVDINPRKSGMFIPGTGQKIIKPAELRMKNVSNIFIMNSNYHVEIAETVDRLGLQSKLFIV